MATEMNARRSSLPGGGVMGLGSAVLRTASGGAPMPLPGRLSRRISAPHISLQQDYFCPICLDFLPGARMYELSRCGHIFCTQCLSELVGIEVREGRVHVKCPFSSEEDTSATPADSKPPTTCGELLADSEITHLLTAWARRHAREKFRADQRLATSSLSLSRIPVAPTISAPSGLDTTSGASGTDRPLCNENPGLPASSSSLASAGSASTLETAAAAAASQAALETAASAAASQAALESIASAGADGFDRAAMEAQAVEDALQRYAVFKLNAENPHMRQCPSCGHSQVGIGPTAPVMTCGACGAVYCFSHSNAHTGKTCAEWEETHAESEVASSTFIAQELHAKPCPTCGMYISKSEGCNQVKCSKCNQSFCWLCGAKVDSSEFPLHFQWWNFNGCPSRQLSTQHPLFLRLLLTAFIFIFFGIPSTALTLLSFTVCGICCWPAALTHEHGPLVYILTISELYVYLLTIMLTVAIALPFGITLFVIALVTLPCTWAIRSAVQRVISSASSAPPTSPIRGVSERSLHFRRQLRARASRGGGSTAEPDAVTTAATASAAALPAGGSAAAPAPASPKGGTAALVRTAVGDDAGSASAAAGSDGDAVVVEVGPQRHLHSVSADDRHAPSSHGSSSSGKKTVTPSSHGSNISSSGGKKTVAHRAAHARGATTTFDDEDGGYRGLSDGGDDAVINVDTRRGKQHHFQPEVDAKGGEHDVHDAVVVAVSASARDRRRAALVDGGADSDVGADV